MTPGIFRQHPSWGAIGAPWAVLALSSILLAGSAAAAAEVELLVEVVDAKGRVPDEVAVADLELREGGTVMPITGVRRWALSRGNARVVLYFEQALSSNHTVKRAASALAGLSRELTGLGEVEVIMAGEVLEPSLRSRDPLVLDEKLSRSALTDTGERRVLELRQRVLRDLRLGSAAASALSPAEVAEVVVTGIEEELELIRERQHRLLAWAGETRKAGAAPASGPRILLLVMDGYDLDPVGFYLQRLGDDAARAVIGGAARLATLEPGVLEMGRTLSALGWTVMPVAFETASGEAAGLEYAPLTVGGEGGATTSAPGITLRPSTLFGRRGKAEESEAKPAPTSFLNPLAPLRLLAEASGGEVIATEAGLRDALARFAGRFAVSYRSPLPLESPPEPIEVRARRADWTVRSRRWLASGIPQQLSEVRLGRLLVGREEDGGFDVAAVLRLEEEPDPASGGAAQLEARLEVRDLAAANPDEEWQGLDRAVFRVSLAIAEAGGEPRIEHEVVRADNLRQLEEWRYRKSLQLPAGATEVAVLIEELAGGYWGGRRATVVQGDWATGGADLLPAPTVVEIVKPDKELLRGRVKFEAEVYDSRVSQVDFLLDDREVASQQQPPWAARLDLGRTPRRRTLTVVAYGAGDVELGRDSVVLNGGGGGLEVEIVRPADFRGTGWVEVEADVSVPAERQLDRVLFFWNNQTVATLYGAPFRQRVFIPEDKPVGYVRVVALLDDGSLAEDVAFMNGTAHGERLEVNLVELYVVVTDAGGRPVRGLEQEEFSIREDGVPQEIATFSDASDLPLTLGMAIDSSASMFVKLPAVQNAAIDFLRSTFSEQDRAFVVDFDTEPRLARSTTGSLDRVVRSISSLEANGRTALWESIVFSLVQLQGVRGRKALIVFSDGADEDDEFPFRSSLSIAKKMGVPIYLILMKKRPEKESGLSLLVRSFTSRVNRLVEATGGRVFYGKEYPDLGAVYQEIEQELRSQYLLAYYPREPSRGESWRTVDIDVARRGLKPRTLSGYWD